MTPMKWLVVVLAHNESADLVLACIESIMVACRALEEQFSGSEAQVCVIDDSAPASAQTWRPQVKAMGVEHVYFQGTIAEKRNAAWQRATVDVIAFTDADCDVDRDWLCGHAMVYAAMPDTPGVIGITRHQSDFSTSYRAAEYAGFLVGFRFPDLMPLSYWGPCSNLSIQRVVLEQIGGFDTTHFRNASEDVDLGLRLYEQTQQLFVCTQQGGVEHAPHPFSKGVLRRALNWGRGEAALMVQHPRFLVTIPPTSTVFSLTVVILALVGLALGQPSLSLAWFIVYGFIGSLVEALQNKKPIGIVGYARVLHGVFQLGMLSELARCGHIALSIKKMNYGEGQLRYEWNNLMRPLWEYLVVILLGILLSWRL